jgi:hypothetical protein
MTPIEIYESFIIKANENAQTDNIAVDKARFSNLYNEASIKFVEWVLEKKNEDEIRYLAPILGTKPLERIEQNKTRALFKLPEDFLDLGNVNGTASGGCCTDVQIELWELKTDNENVILNDEDNKPSIEYREAPYYLAEDKVKVLVDDFEISSLELTYYKYPMKIELDDPNDPESGFAREDTHLEFDPKVINRIVSIAVADYSLNVSSPKFQGDKSRVISKF